MHLQREYCFMVWHPFVWFADKRNLFPCSGYGDKIRGIRVNKQPQYTRRKMSAAWNLATKELCDNTWRYKDVWFESGGITYFHQWRLCHHECYRVVQYNLPGVPGAVSVWNSAARIIDAPPCGELCLKKKSARSSCLEWSWEQLERISAIVDQ